MPKTHFPRLIHRIWLGPRAIPARLDEWWRTWVDFNPEWRCIHWGDDEVNSLVAALDIKHLYQRADRPVIQSDIARIAILWQYGGMYVDADFQCLKPIEPLVRDWERAGYRCVMSLEPYRQGTSKVTNSVALTEPKHEAFKWLLAEAHRRLVRAESYTRSPNPVWSTGPRLWETASEIFRDAVHVAPPYLLVPFGGDTMVDDAKDFTRVPLGAQPPRASFAIHHAAATWRTNHS